MIWDFTFSLGIIKGYEIDVSDTGPVSEDEDILNYDDVDDPDAYV